jgi:6,7-dimethyl-8-ribityllumazine synthase
MSSIGAPETPALDAAGVRIAIVASSWHENIMNSLIAGSSSYLAGAKAEVQVFRVPGSFELPLGAKLAFNQGFDAVVALGLVLRGDTPHFDYVCDGVTSGLMQLMLESNKPIGFGVLTCDTETQALARSGLPGSDSNKGIEAAHAALAMTLLKRKLS